MSLSDRQQKALFALVAGDTITDAAEKAGVSRQTVHTWLTEKEFLAELKRLRELREEEVLETITAATSTAARRLLDLVEDPGIEADDLIRAAGLLFRRLPVIPHEVKRQAWQEVGAELQRLLPTELWSEVLKYIHQEEAKYDHLTDLVSALGLRDAFDMEEATGTPTEESETLRALELDTAKA
jgi:AcrR family transcriptional regulator